MTSFEYRKIHGIQHMLDGQAERIYITKTRWVDILYKGFAVYVADYFKGCRWIASIKTDEKFPVKREDKKAAADIIIGKIKEWRAA